MNHHRVAAIERADEVLATPLSRRRSDASEAIDYGQARRAPHRALSAYLDMLDEPSDKALLKSAPNCLYFGKLGH